MALTVNPTVLFNSSTGSDTAASGAGPGTAVTGTAAAHTGGVASTTITFTNSPDLSGVAQDGSHVLWMKTASGRQFSRISTVDNVAKTCVVEDSFNIASGSAVNYAIGGKRSTFDNADSRTLFGGSGAKSGWIAQTETDQTLNTSALSCNFSATNGVMTVRGDSGTTLRTVSQTATAVNVFSSPSNGGWCFENLKVQNTHASHGGTGINGFVNVTVRNCIVGHATNWLTRGIDCTGHVVVEGCAVVSCHGLGIRQSGGTDLSVTDTIVDSCTSGGILVNDGGGLVSIIDSLIVNCTGSHGVEDSGTVNHGFILKNCTIDNNTGGSGVAFTGGSVAVAWAVINNNQITRNGAYGITATTSGTTTGGYLIDYNNFGTGSTANTSGSTNNVNTGSNNVSVDPQYTATGSLDWSIGTNTKAAGTPPTSRTIGAGYSGSTTYLDIGAVQRQEASGGGGLLVNSGMTGGLRG